MIHGKLGIRAKVAITLAIVAMLPLLATLVVTVVRWSELRIENAGRDLLSLGAAEARGLSVSLVKDIQAFQMDLHDPDIVGPLSKADTKLAPQRLEEIDKAWPAMPLDAPPMAAVLNHPVAPLLKDILLNDNRIVQAFVTDRYGQLVAATGKTIDFNQADEQWWLDACNDGDGQVVMQTVDYDSSVNMFILQVCLPIYDDQTVVGVAKFKLDLAKWITTGARGGADAQLMLVRDDGLIVYRQGQEPLNAKFASLYLPIVKGRTSGWRSVDDEIQSFVPIVLERKIGSIPTKMPEMSLVMYVPQAAYQAPVYRAAWLALAAGLVFIGILFLAGLLMADRLLVRRIRRLEEAARRMAGGDLTSRVNPTGHLLAGADEIDDLEKDFNEMAQRVERSYKELAAADELKSNFIKIASHELRTPVGYILSLVKLLRDCQDGQRLSQAMSSIAAKAKRLDDIIRAMFKLMPGGLSDETMRIEDVVVSELLEGIYVDCFPFVERREQKLTIDCRRAIPTIRADREKLRDVVENLVINAIKFTPDGGSVSVKVNTELGDAISIAVSDQGAGIPAKELPYLFQPFYSGGEILHHSTGQTGFQKQGIGLGLAVVRHFVELHGGTINVNTGPGGSTFTVVIPIRPHTGKESRQDFMI